MKLRNAFITALATLCTLVVVAASVVAPVLWLQAEDRTRLEDPLPRYGESGAAESGGDLYLVRTLIARNDLLRAGGMEAGYQPREALAEELRPTVNARLTAMAKAGVLPAALAGQLAVLLEQSTTRFIFSVDAAGFEQTQCIFNEGPYSIFGIECEPLTGRAVNLWVTAAEGSWQPSAAHPQPEGESSIAPQVLEEMQTESAIFDMTIGDYAQEPTAATVLPGPNPDTALEAYSAWLGLDALDDWTDSGNYYYDRQLVSQKAQLQLYLLCQGKLLSLGIAPLAGTAGGGAG